MTRNEELQAMSHDINRLILRICETQECMNSGCDGYCCYNAICEAAQVTRKFIKRQIDLYNAKGELKDDNN